MAKLTDEITYNLMRYCRSHAYDIILPNFFVGNYEMDVCKIMQSGYMVEYEIKISKSDFKADFKKNNGYNGKSKHDNLRIGERPCNRFFFVVPKDLIQPDEVPDHCGLIYYHDKTFTLVKNAKLLHKNKQTDRLNFYKALAFKLAFREGIMRSRERSARSNYKILLKNTKDMKEAILAALTKEELISKKLWLILNGI